MKQIWYEFNLLLTDKETEELKDLLYEKFRHVLVKKVEELHNGHN